MTKKVLKLVAIIIAIFLIFSFYEVNATNTSPSPEANNTSSTVNNSENTQNNTTQNNVNNTSGTKSADATLKSLTSDIGEISPQFSKDVTEYYLTVDLSVDQINFTATPNDTNAKVNIVGYRKLTKGENTVTITVTAQNGTEKKYIVHVSKVDNTEVSNANLKSISVENYNLSPTFSSNILKYNINVASNTKKLELTTEAEVENANIDITGNENFNEGENVILVKVTAEDGITAKTYQINVYVESDTVKIEEESKIPAFILLAILGICILISISIIMIKKRSKKR